MVGVNGNEGGNGLSIRPLRRGMGLLRCTNSKGNHSSCPAALWRLRDGERSCSRLRSLQNFHAQTAVECAFELHESVKDRLEEIDEITITTHESAIRIISKTGTAAQPRGS